MATVNENTRSKMGPVIFSSTVGTAIEWYDFFLYGTMAALVFNKVFFPESDPIVGTLLALFTFLVGFLARPFGGAFFGHLGDRIGRKSTLIATLLLMGISTLLIGFLPGYSTLGLFAALILVLLRLGQGLGVGGEWGGSVLLAMEYGHKGRRGFWASWPQIGAPLGLVLSTLTINIVQYFTGSNFTSWGWRIPFLISALLIVIGLYIRLNILETPLFAQVKEQKREVKAPIIEAFRHSTPEILLSAGARFVENAPFYIFATFVVVYGADKLLLGRTLILNAVTIAAVAELFTIPLFGHLSDSFGRRKWYLLGCVLMAAFAFPYFWLMNSGSGALFILAVVLSLAVFHSWVYGPQAALIAERFGTRSRYSGASLGYQLAAPFAGGLAPIIAILLLNGKSTLGALGLSKVVINLGAGSWQAVAIYLIVLSAISFGSVLGLKELTKADISNVEAYKVTEAEVVLASTD
jgi:metabolite-proton symporter